MEQNFFHSRRCPICSRLCSISNPALLSPFIMHRLFGYGFIQINKKWKLRDFKKGNSYYPCESVFCKSCNFLFSGLRFNDLQMSQIYKGYRKNKYNSLRKLYEPDYIKKITLLKKKYNYLDEIENYILKHIKFLPKKILDYGGDEGKNTPFQKKVKSFDIFDISGVKIESKLKKNITVSKIEKKKYDLTICAHVIEHTPKIYSFLNNIKKKVKSKYFYFEVPFEKIMFNSGETNFSYQKNKKFWHEHVNFFSIKSLKKLFFLTGFKIVNIESKEIKESNHVSIIRTIVKKK